MSVERIFPINRPYYDLPQVETFKEMIDRSESLYSDRPAYKLKNKDGVYYEVTYKNFRHAIYYLANTLIKDGYSRNLIDDLFYNNAERFFEKMMV